jgi:hypothetical protein
VLARSESQSRQAHQTQVAGGTAACRAVNHENIFIAKICDSESAAAAVLSRKTTHHRIDRPCAYRAMIEESPAAQDFRAILTNADADCCGISRISISTH